MSQIVTVTFNPCVDKSTFIEALVPYKKMRCTPFVHEAGGGGINVARAIKKLGGEALAIYLAGGDTGTTLQSLLKAEEINSIVIETSVDTRENIMVVDRATNLQYRFITPGNEIKQTHWQQCLKKTEEIPQFEYLVVSGSLQPGIPNDIFMQLSSIAKSKNAKLIVDVPTETLQTHTVRNAYLFKPNLNELSLLTGHEELHGSNVIDAAKQLISEKVCEVVVVSMGAAGALLVTKDISEQITAPPAKRKSTVGAGDSMVGGIVLSLSQNKNISYAVRYGVACGTAATLNEGTQLCKLYDVEKLLHAMKN